MAKSRKSNKADRQVDGGNETPQDAEKIVSAEELEAALSDDETVSDTAQKPEESATDAETATSGGDDDTPEPETEVSDVAEQEPRPDDAGVVEETASDEDAAKPEESPEADAADISDAEAGEQAPEDVLASEEGTDQTGTDKPEETDLDTADVVTPLDTTDIEADKTETEEPQKAGVAGKPQPKPEPQVVRGSIWPAFFGGIIAAMIGFIAGRGDMLDGFFPPDEQPPAIDVAAIEATASEIEATVSEQAATLAAQASALEEQSARLEALEAASASGASEAVASLEDQIDAMTARIAELESRPVDTGGGVEPEDVSELQAALDAQKAEIDALAARAEAAEAQAAGEAARILARAAMLRVVTAVDSGEAFTPALEELESVAPVKVPDPLRAAAETGVPTVATLQESFPDAARAALSAARAEVPESEVVGITEFLKRQLNVRSVVPREGDDPDAVLSRAQAAVNVGDINTALTELEALPEAGRAAMSDWLEAASARSAAQNAANALADSLNSN